MAKMSYSFIHVMFIIFISFACFLIWRFCKYRRNIHGWVCIVYCGYLELRLAQNFFLFDLVHRILFVRFRTGLLPTCNAHFLCFWNVIPFPLHFALVQKKIMQIYPTGKQKKVCKSMNCIFIKYDFIIHVTLFGDLFPFLLFFLAFCF